MPLWDKTSPFEFNVDIQTEKRYYPLERKLAKEVDEIARKQGVGSEALLNLWIKEKLIEQKA